MARSGLLRTRAMVASAFLECLLLLVGAAPAWASSGTVQWHGCRAELPPTLQCGELSVPLDYRHPRGAQITLGFNRLPAKDPAHRIGSLILNPGGPGGAGSEVVVVEAAGARLWDPGLNERFDLIGMDPRGIGLSTRVQCDPAVVNQPVLLFPRTRAEFRLLADHARAVGESCLELTGPLLGLVDTVSVARDMEALRRALGEGKLNFLGLSYGAELGAQYAELYPKRIRVMALDGALEHSLSGATLFADAATGYEDTLQRFGHGAGGRRAARSTGAKSSGCSTGSSGRPTGSRSPLSGARWHPAARP
jgi:pimeloyl-ACP methyl ester carboxylesterase